MKKLEGTGYSPGYAKGFISVPPLPDTDLSQRIILLEEPNIDMVLRLSTNRPAGVVVIGGTRFSHLVIYLCSLSVPTVFIEDRHKTDLQENMFVLLNSYTGLLILSPDKEHYQAWNKKSAEDIGTRLQVSTNNSGEARTRDNVPVTVGASISSPYGASNARLYGADEVGLLRSEFLFASDADLTEPITHINALQEVCKAAAPLLVKIRLLDVGGEKTFKWVPKVDSSDKTLGVRGSRLYKYEQFSALFHSQLKAISSLLGKYDISILIPFVSNIKEYTFIRNIIENVIGRGSLPIGAMIETPSMCFSLPEMAGIADYVALGTNDLMQCFFGADRGLKATSQYFEPYSPSLFRMLQIVASDAKSQNLPLQVCGQLALYPFISTILIGLGFRHFSVEPYAVPALKEIIKSLDVSQMQKDILSVLRLKEADDVKAFFEKEFCKQSEVRRL